jgi:phosphoglycolate phosphatase-like HAD superfamily hydrolase
MRPLLADCVAAGVRLGVFTGRARDSTALILRSLGLATFFGAVIAGDDVVQPKPAPDGVDALMRGLGVPPAATLVVGDSRLDLQAAHAAGAGARFAAWFHPGTAPPGSLDCPDRLRPILGLPSAR